MTVATTVAIEHEDTFESAKGARRSGRAVTCAVTRQYAVEVAACHDIANRREHMSDHSWLEFQRRNIEQYGESQQRAWLSTVEFWKHLVMVEATVLGLTVGLLGAGHEGAPVLLVLAWIALLLGIFVGCVLIRGGIEAEQSRKHAAFNTAYDLAEIRQRVNDNTLLVESPEYQGLVLAATMQSTPEWERKKNFSPKAEEMATPWFDRLPTGRLLKKKTATIYRWLEQHLVRVEMAFYAFSVTAFVLMTATILAPAAHP